MKSILCLVTVSLSIVSSAYAEFPTVGDRATYRCSRIDGSKPYLKYLQVLEADAEADRFIVDSQTDPQREDPRSLEYSISDQLSRMKTIPSMCAESGGVMETLAVSGKDYEACHLEHEGLTSVWMADIPFLFMKTIDATVQNPVVCTMIEFSVQD